MRDLVTDWLRGPVETSFFYLVGIAVMFWICVGQSTGHPNFHTTQAKKICVAYGVACIVAGTVEGVLFYWPNTKWTPNSVIWMTISGPSVLLSIYAAVRPASWGKLRLWWWASFVLLFVFGGTIPPHEFFWFDQIGKITQIKVASFFIILLASF